MHHLLLAIQQRRRIRAQPLQHLFDQARLLKLWNQRRVFEADPAKQRGDSDCDESCHQVLCGDDTVVPGAGAPPSPIAEPDPDGQGAVQTRRLSISGQKGGGS